MTDEQLAAAIHAWSVIAELKMQGMIAMNKRRELQGEALAYGEESFFAVEGELQSKLDEYGI
jgi:hypothetical protein